MYRVTEQLVQNLPLTSKQKFHPGVSWPGPAKAKLLFQSQREVLHKLLGHPIGALFYLGEHCLSEFEATNLFTFAFSGLSLPFVSFFFGRVSLLTVAGMSEASGS